MRVIKCGSYEDMSRTAAKMVSGQIMLKPNSVIGLATGSTPIGMYAELSKLNREGEVDFSNTATFNLDEYYPIKRDNDQSYYYFMNEHLYSKVNLKPENVHIPNGSAADVDAECANYDAEIERRGGIDLQILGIGNNGHIGFNEPADELNSRTHLTALTDNTIEANSRFFASSDDVPRHAITMGMATDRKSTRLNSSH